MGGRVALGILLLGVMACGQETSAPDVAAPGPAATNGERCLDLVARTQFEQAIPVCSRAIAEQPDDERIQDALETARDGVRDAAAAARRAAEQAGSSADEAARGLKEVIP